MGKIAAAGDSVGAASSFGNEFSDESFCIKHNAAGMVGMCKRAGLAHTNESQFYITTNSPLDFLDGENVVFGRIVRGYSTIEKIESLAGPNEKATEHTCISASCEYNGVWYGKNENWYDVKICFSSQMQ